MADGMGCTVSESYIIPGIWQITEIKTQYKVTLYPGEVND
jgi:hypothetical protein